MTNPRSCCYILFSSTPVSADNVHFQNTAQLVEALTEANVLFDMQVYKLFTINFDGQ